MLNGTTLGDNIYNAIQAMNDTNKHDSKKVWEIIGQQIVTHITTSGQVNLGIAVQVNVATGTGATTATGTIS